MDNKKFIELATKAILEHGDLKDASQCTVTPVWLSKVLLNNKALFIVFPEMLYVEVTHDGVGGVFYMDTYKKQENMVIPVSDLEDEDRKYE